MSQLNVYKASAGSGKTFRLAAEYIKIVVSNPKFYGSILAVTFTNKATAEMKSRILDELYRLSNGEKTAMSTILLKETKISENQIPERASEALSYILHNYSRFSVSTIDSFVQKIIQSLLWELGLKGSFELELDNKLILERAADLMLDETTEDSSLFNWFKLMGESNLESGRSWDIRRSLTNLGKELFSESFRLIKSEEIGKITNRNNIEEFKRHLNKIINDYINHLNRQGNSALELIADSGLDVSHFNYKGSGIYNFFKKCADIKVFDDLPDDKGSRILSALNDTTGVQWQSGDARKDVYISKKVIELSSQRLNPILNEILGYIELNKRSFLSARLILKNLDSLAVLGELWQTIRKLSEEEGFILLSDCAPLLQEFIKESDSPFLYEKIGNKYRNFMIDEFQDTSVIQWQNFKPLIINSLAQNDFSMLVGDVKQAIYRWRNGDWKILSSGLQSDFDVFGINTVVLEENYRSLSTVVDFNNRLFAQASLLIKEELKSFDHNGNDNDNLSFLFDEAYKDLLQKPVRSSENKGYVEVNILPNSDDISYEQNLASTLPLLISDIQQRGYQAGDIAILVRRNDDGQKVANILISYKKDNPNVYGSFEVISQDGLKLNSSPVVRLIIAAFKAINDPKDLISKASFVKELKQLGLVEENDWNLLFSNEFINQKTKCLIDLKFRTIPEILDFLIKNFSLADLPMEQAYIAEFQEKIYGLTRSGSINLNTLLQWWDEKSETLSLSMPESRNAITIMTIHKSKGLQFPVVIVPYAGWKFRSSRNQPFLWVSSGQEPFNLLPKYPVQYSKEEMAESHFENFAKAEEMQTMVDNLNLLYVAFTRPKNELYVFCNQFTGKTEFIGTDHLIESTVPKLDYSELQRLELENTLGVKYHTYFSGEKTINQASNINDDSESWVMDSYPIEDVKTKVKQRYEYLALDNVSQSDAKARLTYGRIMHAIFSKIISKNDINSALDQIKVEGLITELEKQSIESDIENIVNKPPFDDWFSDKWIVKTEASILTPDGLVYRPDRVMVRDQNAVIVDYKFGKEVEAYKYQISKYSELLKQMGYTKVEGYLWYINSDKLTRIIHE